MARSRHLTRSAVVVPTRQTAIHAASRWGRRIRIFDVDATLARSEPHHIRSWKQAGRVYISYHLGERHDLFAKFDGIIDAVFLTGKFSHLIDDIMKFFLENGMSLPATENPPQVLSNDGVQVREIEGIRATDLMINPTPEPSAVDEAKEYRARVKALDEYLSGLRLPYFVLAVKEAGRIDMPGARTAVLASARDRIPAYINTSATKGPGSFVLRQTLPEGGKRLIPDSRRLFGCQLVDKGLRRKPFTDSWHEVLRMAGLKDPSQSVIYDDMLNICLAAADDGFNVTWLRDPHSPDPNTIEVFPRYVRRNVEIVSTLGEIHW